MNFNKRLDAEALNASRLALVVEYDGTRYRGFQWQSLGPTVQEELEQALKNLTGEEIKIAGAARTDAGVHALGQVVSFLSGSSLPLQSFVAGLNYYLPEEISVREAARVPIEFDPRRQAHSRLYRYAILNRSARSSLFRRFSYWLKQELNVEAMNEAGKMLIGVHDFASFSAPMNRDVVSTVREVFHLSVRRQGELILIDMEANAFLAYQVRRTAGALAEVGQGKMSLQDFRDLLDNPKGGTAGPSLPGHGLYLIRVEYPEYIFEDKRTASILSNADSSSIFPLPTAIITG